MIRASSLAANGRFWLSKAYCAPCSCLPAIASLRLVDETFQTNKTAATTSSVMTQLVACLWALVQASTRSRNGSTCVVAPGCVTDCVAISPRGGCGGGCEGDRGW